MRRRKAVAKFQGLSARARRDELSAWTIVHAAICSLPYQARAMWLFLAAPGKSIRGSIAFKIAAPSHIRRNLTHYLHLLTPQPNNSYRHDSPSVEWHEPQKHVDTPQKTRLKTLKNMGTTSTDIFKKTGVKQRTQVNIISSNYLPHGAYQAQ